MPGIVTLSAQDPSGTDILNMWLLWERFAGSLTRQKPAGLGVPFWVELGRNCVMSFKKHVAGFALFTVILSSIILINNFLTHAKVKVPSSHLRLPFSVREETPEQRGYTVRLVSLDFIHKQIYTALTLERQPGESGPQSLWVTTHFFSPDYPGRVWTSVAEIRQPFARADRIEYVATAPCNFCASPDTPRAGYFARVKISTDYSDQAPLPFDRDLATAERVVVQAEKNLALPVVR